MRDGTDDRSDAGTDQAVQEAGIYLLRVYISDIAVVYGSDAAV